MRARATLLRSSIRPTKELSYRDVPTALAVVGERTDPSVAKLEDIGQHTFRFWRVISPAFTWVCPPTHAMIKHLMRAPPLSGREAFDGTSDTSYRQHMQLFTAHY